MIAIEPGKFIRPINKTNKKGLLTLPRKGTVTINKYISFCANKNLLVIFVLLLADSIIRAPGRKAKTLNNAGKELSNAK
ncbi:hypothetical protein AN2V17_37230 [Vallitalea sp. AN17-2]|uniref:Uncharacterized protein n=1 Tax=Vallitalea maricola TaxID=3074433 RepID=A0ACB5UNX7_9FIRM|nr:hypothetical protein AN2V17_37230 [Vallitalea sp. AN17-2]